MEKERRIFRKLTELAFWGLLFAVCFTGWIWKQELRAANLKAGEPAEDYIKWVEFAVPCEALQQAYDWDVKTFGTETHLNWIALLAYLAADYWGDFENYEAQDLDALAQRLTEGETTLEELGREKEYYAYYQEAYAAVLDGMVGEYEIQVPDENGNLVWESRYGLKAFSPIAKGFPYYDYDDFGAARSYGYNRPHLGHDMMGQIGTPIIAIESGYVEALGWNQYGGWRVGIRSFDGKRYYYYAHLRQNVPYHQSLEEGSVVQAGDVIGYMGHTGYSAEENVNNIDVVHLHWGLQLIFDESQKDGTNQIWVNCYELSKFLAQNRSETRKNQKTGDYERVYDMREMEKEPDHSVILPDQDMPGDAFVLRSASGNKTGAEESAPYVIQEISN